MKKTIYYISSSILQIIISLYMAIFSNKFLSGVINTYKELYEETQEELWLESIKMYESHGESILIILALVTIILNSIILFNLLKKKDDYTQSKLILFAGLICFLTTESEYISMLSLINIIVWVFTFKKENVNNKVEDKSITVTEIPKVERWPVHKKEKILAIFALVTYFFLPEVIGLLPFSYIPLSIILDISLIIICLLIFYKELERDFKILWQNKKEYLKFIINKQVVMFFIYYLVALLVVLIKGDDSVSVNQQIAESLPLLYVIPTCLIYAPFVEELIFRGAIRRIIINDKLFIVISGLLFGLLHTMSEATIFDILVLSLPYAVLGSYFAYLYVKTENSTVSMVAHFIHNAFACLMMVIA